MAKPKSGYKRPFRYQPPTGEDIPVSEATYQALKIAAFNNSVTIGQWCEITLRKYLALGVNIALPKDRPAPTGKPVRKRSFEISQQLYFEIERFVADRNRSPVHWIGSVILYALAIERERDRGERAEPDRFGW